MAPFANYTRRTTGASFAFIALAAVAGIGQTPSTGVRPGGNASSSDAGYSFTTYFDAPTAPMLSSIAGAPYSGEEVIEYSEMRSDGSRFARKVWLERTCRDSQGRIRTERPISLPPTPLMPGGFAVSATGGGRTVPSPIQAMPSGDVPNMILILDPVASRQCVLDTPNRVAHCSAVQMEPPEPGWAAEPFRPPLSPEPLPPGTESLGTQTIDGVLAVGIRTSQTIPAGEQGAIVVVTETWTSPELRITMLQKTVDPRYGEGTLRIENFSRADQDLSLFYPSGYAIRQETGWFRIDYRNQ